MILEKQNVSYVLRRKLQRMLCSVLGPVCFTKLFYRIKMHKGINLENPITYDDKVSWYKLYYCSNSPQIIECADKYRVRDYLKRKGYEANLPKLLGVWNNANDIDFDKLPSKFVLKCNHGCAYNVICENKDKLDIDSTKRMLNKWLKEDFGKYNAEYHYDKIEKKIICEEFLDMGNGALPEDYKFICMDGKVKCIKWISERSATSKKDLSYDLQGNVLPWSVDKDDRALDISIKQINRLKEISENIAKDFPLVRVDFYIIHTHIYIGELTFTPAAGVDDTLSEIGQKELGSLWNLDIGKLLL